MKHNLLSLVFFFLSSGFLYSQEKEPLEIYHYFQNGDTLVLSNGGHVRSTPSRNGKSIDQLPIGSVVYINEEVDYQGTGSEVIYNLKAGYYPVRYEKAGEWKKGYVWGGLIAHAYSTDKNNNLFILGKRSFDSEAYEATYAVIRIDGTTKRVYEQLFAYPIGGQSSFESKIIGGMGLSTIQQIFRVGFLGGACGVFTTYHYFGWNGQKFIELPTKNSMGDAGVLSYGEELFFPSEHKIGKDLIIVRSTSSTTDYQQYSEIEGHEFEIEEIQIEQKVYFWDGKTIKLLEPIKVE